MPELLAAGHEVSGLARSGTAADTVAALGAQVHRGTLDDVESLRSGAARSDGVVHLGYHHDFSQMSEAAQIDRRAIETFSEVRGGTDCPLGVASGLLGLGAGRCSGGRRRSRVCSPISTRGGTPTLSPHSTAGG